MATEMSPTEVEKTYQEKMGLDLGSLYHRLSMECVSLHWKWSEFIELFGTSEDRIAVLNSSAPSFFRMVEVSLREDILLHIARLVDFPRSVGKPNLSVKRLPELVDPEIQVKVKQHVETAEQKCGAARTWRNRRIAHRDLDLALKRPVEALPAAGRDEITEALRSIANLLNILEQHYCGAEVAYAPSGSRNSVRMISLLRDGLDANAARRERLRTGKELPEDLAKRKPI